MTHDFSRRERDIFYCAQCAIILPVSMFPHQRGRICIHTLPVNEWMTQRDTVTVAVLFIKPTLVTTPLNPIGGIGIVG